MATNKVFKGARVYQKLSDDFITPPDTILIPNHINLYIFKRDIDSESESELNTDPEDSDSESEDSFVVSDTEELLDVPPSDEVWANWRPMTAGAKRFKDQIDKIESHVKQYTNDRFVSRSILRQ